MPLSSGPVTVRGQSGAKRAASAPEAEEEEEEEVEALAYLYDVTCLVAIH